MFKVPEKYRIVSGVHFSDSSCGNNGAFLIPIPESRIVLMVVASDGAGWEHVSVS